MVTAYTGPGWEHPERKKIFGGSLADVYIHDGFTVASIVEPSDNDRARVATGRDIAIYSPVDRHQSVPMIWVRDLFSAEKYIAEQRRFHPDWPTVPVPLEIIVPHYTQLSEARDAVREIITVLEARELDLHGYNVWRTAVLLFTYCQRMFINQSSVDRAQKLDAVTTDLIGKGE
jgi:hypothetical protein